MFCLPPICMDFIGGVDIIHLILTYPQYLGQHLLFNKYLLD